MGEIDFVQNDLEFPQPEFVFAMFETLVGSQTI